MQENLRVEILVSEMKTYQLHFAAVDEDGSTVDVENVLRASWNGTELENGTAYTAYIPVDFTTSLPEEYQVKNWTLRQGGGGETVVAEGKDAVTYTLSSLSDETWVTVHLEKRPTLTYEAVEIPGADAGNTVTCGELQSGSYLDKYRTEDIVLTVSPDYGYEIETVLINGETLEAAAGTVIADTAGSCDRHGAGGKQLRCSSDADARRAGLYGRCKSDRVLQAGLSDKGPSTASMIWATAYTEPWRFPSTASAPKNTNRLQKNRHRAAVSQIFTGIPSSHLP